MIDTNGSIQYEIGDAVQVVHGQDQGTFGVIVGIAGEELTLWGRVPASYGSQAYKFSCRSLDVMFVGRGKIRPLFPGEIKRDVGELPVHRRPRQPSTLSRRMAPRPLPPIPQPPQVVPQPAVAPTVPKGPAAVGLHDVQFGGVDSDQVRIPRPPSKYPEPTPEMLEVAVFRGPTAAEAHHLDRSHETKSIPTQSPNAAPEGEPMEIPVARPKRAPRRRKERDVAQAQDPALREQPGS